MTEEEILALPLHDRARALESIARAELDGAKADFIDAARTILYVGGITAIVICALFALGALA